MSASRMLEEALSAPEVVKRHLSRDADLYRELASRLGRSRPRVLVTLARGSSDHAASFASYLVMTRVGVPAASIPPSVFTLYAARLDVTGAAALAISQSGQSPDIVRSLAACREGGALSIALTNDAASPLAIAAEWALPLHAGEERSVAATKTVLASLAASARLVAEWTEDSALRADLDALPDDLARAGDADVSPLVERLAGAERLLVLGRGLAFSIALEAALKLKETCALQAEAFTDAEVRHGPIALVEAGYPLVVFAPRGPAQAGVLRLAAELRERNARVILFGPPSLDAADVRVPESRNPTLDPLCHLLAFYAGAARLAAARGLDPDTPRHLRKVTRTV